MRFRRFIREWSLSLKKHSLSKESLVILYIGPCKYRLCLSLVSLGRDVSIIPTVSLLVNIRLSGRGSSIR